MADDFTPVLGVEGDPAREDADLEQSVDPGFVDAILAEDSAGEFAGLLDEVVLPDDSIPMLVGRIHDEILELLQLHRDIADGIELATDQVQDKRIEFLEAGPEVTVASFFVESALVFFISSPLAGIVIARAFRFAGDAARAAFLARRAAKLKRLTDRAQVLRGRLADNARKGAEVSGALRKLRDAQRQTRNINERHALSSRQAPLIQRQREIDEERRGIGAASDALEGQPEALAQRTDVTAKALKQFFTEKEKFIADLDVAALKTAKGVKRPTTTKHGAAADTLGVQIKALSQDLLRGMERYLGHIAADADFLRSVATIEPLLQGECVRQLAEMLATLRGKERPVDPVDARLEVMLAVEQLLWAFLVVDGFPNAFKNRPKPLADRTVADTIAALPLPNVGFVIPPEVGQGILDAINAPPGRTLAYVRDRFFADEPKPLSDQDVYDRLRALKKKFEEAAEGEELMTVIRPLQEKAVPASP